MVWATWLVLMFGFLLGHGWLVLLVLVLLWWGFDRAWIGAWSGPRRALRQRRDLARLQVRLSVNPSDRDARFGVAEWLVSKRRCDEALALVEQNLAAGDDDVDTLLLAGKAAFGSSRPGADDEGLAWLERARARASNLRRPIIDLELGRGLSRHRRWDEARAALESMCAAQPGTVEGRVLLANVLAQLGDAAGSTRMRAEAWESYRAKPAFQRRRERSWAWKAKPSAAVAYFGMVGAGLAAAVWALVQVGSLITHDFDPGDPSSYLADIDEEGWNVDMDLPAPATSRFERRDTRRQPARRELARTRDDLNGNGEVDLRRKALGADFICRMPSDYGAPKDGIELDEEVADLSHVEWVFLDRETDADILVVANAFGVEYFVDAPDLETAETSLFAFERMIEAQPLRNCALRLGAGGPRVGIREGTPFFEPR